MEISVKDKAGVFEIIYEGVVDLLRPVWVTRNDLKHREKQRFG